MSVKVQDYMTKENVMIEDKKLLIRLPKSLHHHLQRVTKELAFLRNTNQEHTNKERVIAKISIPHLASLINPKNSSEEKLSHYLNQANVLLEVELGASFLEQEKYVIHDHLCIVSDVIRKAHSFNALTFKGV